MDVREQLADVLASRTQADLARQMQVSEAYLSLILAGKRGVSVPMAKKLSGITGIPAAKWLDLEPTE